MAGSITSTSLSDKLPAIPEYDAIIIGSGIGGLVTVTQLIVKGVKIIVSESYIIPGGSSSYFEGEGYTLEVSVSIIFSFDKKGTTNLLTRALLKSIKVSKVLQ